MTIRVLLASADRDVEVAVRASLERDREAILLGVVVNRGALFTAATAGEVDVILLEQRFGGAPALDMAGDLVAAAPEVGLVLVSGDTSEPVLQAALRAGVRGVARLPLRDEELHQAVREAAAWSRLVRPRMLGSGHEPSRASGLGVLVVLAGGKGGVGTTTLAVHLAVAAQERDRRICLVDLDLPAGDARSLLGLPLGRDLGALVAEGAVSSLAIEDQLALHPTGLRVLLPPPDGEDAEQVSPELVGRVLGHLRTRFDVVVIDVGTFLTRAAVHALRMADRVAVVTTPDVPSLRATGRLLARWRRERIRDDGVRVLLNRTGRHDAVTTALMDRVLAAPLLQTAVPADFSALRAPANTGMAERLAAGSLRTAISYLAEELGLAPEQRRNRSPYRRSPRVSAAIARSVLEEAPAELPARTPTAAPALPAGSP